MENPLWLWTIKVFVGVCDRCWVCRPLSLHPLDVVQSAAECCRFYLLFYGLNGSSWRFNYTISLVLFHLLPLLILFVMLLTLDLPLCTLTHTNPPAAFNPDLNLWVFGWVYAVFGIVEPPVGHHRLYLTECGFLLWKFCEVVSSV